MSSSPVRCVAHFIACASRTSGCSSKAPASARRPAPALRGLRTSVASLAHAPRSARCAAAPASPQRGLSTAENLLARWALVACGACADATPACVWPRIRTMIPAPVCPRLALATRPPWPPLVTAGFSCRPGGPPKLVGQSATHRKGQIAPGLDLHSNAPGSHRLATSPQGEPQRTVARLRLRPGLSCVPTGLGA
jgi:hypothetical protein